MGVAELHWRGGGYTRAELRAAVAAGGAARLNHFPGAGLLCKKDELARTLRRYAATHGRAAYGFSPSTYVLPHEYDKFVREYTAEAEARGLLPFGDDDGVAPGPSSSSGESTQAPKDTRSRRADSGGSDDDGTLRSSHPPDAAGRPHSGDSATTSSRRIPGAGRSRQLWIVKPTDLSRGRGIFLLGSIDELEYDCACVVQKYIAPKLIGGYKFDLRLYVLVSSVHPLCVYLYGDGLARFSTEKYAGSAHTDLFAHLTNASINRHNEGELRRHKDTIGSGAKWTLRRLLAHLKANGADVDALWSRIKAIVALTLLPLPAAVSRDLSAPCFELYGFDIMLDEALRPWLLEVNMSPALAADSAVDDLVKLPLIRDTVNVLRVVPDPVAAIERAAAKAAQEAAENSQGGKRGAERALANTGRAAVLTRARPSAQRTASSSDALAPAARRTRSLGARPKAMDLRRAAWGGRPPSAGRTGGAPASASVQSGAGSTAATARELLQSLGRRAAAPPLPVGRGAFERIFPFDGATGELAGMLASEDARVVRAAVLAIRKTYGAAGDPSDAAGVAKAPADNRVRASSASSVALRACSIRSTRLARSRRLSFA